MLTLSDVYATMRAYKEKKFKAACAALDFCSVDYVTLPEYGEINAFQRWTYWPTTGSVIDGYGSHEVPPAVVDDAWEFLRLINVLPREDTDEFN